MQAAESQSGAARERVLAAIAAVWAFVATLSRSLRPPNDWAEAHWLIGYRFGPIKRGLPGTLLEPLIGAAPAHGERIVIGTAFLVLALFVVVILCMAFTLMRRCGWSAESILIVLMFLTSPFVVITGHLTGYFDALFLMLAWLAIACMLRGRPWIAALVVSVGLLVHESMIAIGFPTVVWVAWVMHLRDRQAARDAATGSLVRRLLPFALPVVVFVALLAVQALNVDAPTLRVRLIEHLSRFDFIRDKRDVNVALAFTTGFGQYLAQEGPEFLRRLFRMRYVTSVLPGVALMLIVLARWLRAAGLPAATVVAAAAIAMLPLAMLVIAWDTGRIWTYMLVVMWTALWAASRLLPPGATAAAGSRRIVLAFAGVVVVNLFMYTPLMDSEVERHSAMIRPLLYAPLLLAIPALRNGLGSRA